MISLHKLSCSQKPNLALCCRWHRFEKHVLASLGLLCAVTAFNRKQNWAMRNTLTRFDFTGKSSTKPRFRKKADSWRGPSVRFMFFLVTSPRRENTLWNVICLMHQLMNLMAVNHGCTRIIYPVLAPFRAQIPPLPLWTKHDACLWYGRIITSNHILPNKETISCVSRLCFRLPAETESAVMALTLHLPAHHLHSPAGERCWGVHLHIPRAALKHSHRSARRRTLGCPHTHGEGCRWSRVADSYSVFLEPVMCCQSIYRGRGGGSAANNVKNKETYKLQNCRLQRECVVFRELRLSESNIALDKMMWREFSSIKAIILSARAQSFLLQQSHTRINDLAALTRASN